MGGRGGPCRQAWRDRGGGTGGGRRMRRRRAGGKGKRNEEQEEDERRRRRRRKKRKEKRTGRSKRVQCLDKDGLQKDGGKGLVTPVFHQG